MVCLLQLHLFVHSLQISKASVECCDLIVRIRVIVDGASLSWYVELMRTFI